MSDNPSEAREILEYRGRSIELVASDAIRPLMPILPSQRMTWEVRATDDPELLFGFIAADGPDEFYAYDPAAFGFGIGIACRTRDDAVAILLDEALPEIGPPAEE